MIRRIVVAVLATVLVGGGYWLFWQSPWLTVKKTTVTVAPPTSGIGKWKDPELVSRVRRALPDVTGAHLVSVDAADLSRRASAVRGVGDVEIRRGWPDAVVVVVTPAQPVAYVRRTTRPPVEPATGSTASSTSASPSSKPNPSASPSTDGSASGDSGVRVNYALIDARGVVVDERRTPPTQWPLLGSKVKSPGGKAALDVLMDLPPWLRAKVVAIRSQRQSSADTVEFTLRSGRTIVWGAVDNGARKADVLKAMLRFEGRVIDVSAPEVPVTRK